jgi:hypothetical protein
MLVSGGNFASHKHPCIIRFEFIYLSYHHHKRLRQSLAQKQFYGGTRRAERVAISISESPSMNYKVEFQMVCGDCGSLAIKIENPASASRKTIVYCGECGASRGTVGALRDLAVRPDAHVLSTRPRVPKVKSSSELVSMHKELQSLRRKVQPVESVTRTEQ